MSNTNQRFTFFIVFLMVTGALVLGSWSILAFINEQVQPAPRVTGNDELSPIYVDYQADVDEWVSAEAYRAMAAYQVEYPEPRNVQVLQGLTTQEVNGYMMNYVVAGLNVNCTYCHSLENFAADEWGDPEAETRKANARLHLQLVRDLNSNWLANLDQLTDEKKPSGAQILCATCHYGQAQPQIWEPIASLPMNFRLPLEESLQGDQVDYLNVNARTDVSLDRVQYQQQVMYYMNFSMNVGCTHCHNSRYFPSREVPAIHYAQNMLNMTQYINETYSESLGGQQPNCQMCHANAIIPPGAGVSADILPPALTGELELVPVTYTGEGAGDMGSDTDSSDEGDSNDS